MVFIGTNIITLKVLKQIIGAFMTCSGLENYAIIAYSLGERMKQQLWDVNIVKVSKSTLEKPLFGYI